jgi:hypothetical protein
MVADLCNLANVTMRYIADLRRSSDMINEIEYCIKRQIYALYLLLAAKFLGSPAKVTVLWVNFYVDICRSNPI